MDISNLQDRQEPIKVALYLRVSSEEQVEKYGLELQKECLVNYIKSKGVIMSGPRMGEPLYQVIKEEYIDDDVSGTIPHLERPAFAKMMEDYSYADEDDKPFELVAVYKIDRLARRLKILLDITTLFDSIGLQFASATESIDTSTPFGQAMLGILGLNEILRWFFSWFSLIYSI